MKQSIRNNPRTPLLRQAALLSFVFFALALCSLVPTSGGAQNTPQQKDERGLGVRTEVAKPASPEEVKARAARPEIVLQTGYTIGGLTGMTFSPDGRLLATRVFNSSQVKLWDTATGRELRTVFGSSGAGFFGMLVGVSSLAFSPDGRTLALGGTDNSIKLLDVGSGRELRTIGAAPGAVLGVVAMAFSPDGRRLMSFGTGVTFWDVATGQQAGSLELTLGAGGGPVSVGFTLTPDGAQLAVVASDPKQPAKLAVKFIDLATAREARSVALPDDFRGMGSSHLAFTPDGRLVAAAQTFSSDAGTQIKFWDLSAKSKGRVLVPKVPTNKLVIPSFSPDGRVLSLAVGNTMRFWDTATGAELRSLEVPASSTQFTPELLIVSTAYSRDGRLLATGGSDMSFHLWETTGPRRTLTLAGHTNHAFDARFSPDGTRLYAGGKTVWDVSSGRGVRASASDPGVFIESLSPDGRLLARRTMRDNRIELYEAATRRRLHTLAPAEEGMPLVAVFSPDGRLIASANMPTNWTQAPPPTDEDEGDDDEETQKAMKEAMKKAQKDPSATMKAMQDAMAQTNNRGLGAGRGGQVRVWDTSSGLEVRTINTPGSGNPYALSFVRQVAFSADGPATLRPPRPACSACPRWAHSAEGRASLRSPSAPTGGCSQRAASMSKAASTCQRRWARRCPARAGVRARPPSPCPTRRR
ncbi:MAG: WD40 repeat domain-containing protein [Acidobacteria bacterium]|nr:WD40 repeat domain-containing protein [Acidobacteriota bacterium]